MIVIMIEDSWQSRINLSDELWYKMINYKKLLITLQTESDQSIHDE